MEEKNNLQNKETNVQPAQVPVEATQPVEQPKKKKSPILGIIIVILIVVLAGVAGITLLDKKENKEGTTTKVAEEEKYYYKEELKLSDYINVDNGTLKNNDLKKIQMPQGLLKIKPEDVENNEVIKFKNNTFTIIGDKEYKMENVEQVEYTCERGTDDSCTTMYYVLKTAEGYYLLESLPDNKYSEFKKIADNSYKIIAYIDNLFSGISLYGINAQDEYINLATNKKEEILDQKDLFYSLQGLTVKNDRTLYVNGENKNIKVASVIETYPSNKYSGFSGIIDTEGNYYDVKYTKYSYASEENGISLPSALEKKGKIKKIEQIFKDKNDKEDGINTIKFTFENGTTFEKEEVEPIEVLK